MATDLILPLNVSFPFWCAKIKVNLQNYNIPLPPKDDTNWWTWAESLLLINGNLNGIPIPSRSSFPKKEDWRKWAIFFNRNVTV